MADTNIGDITIDVSLKDVINTITVLKVATPIIIPSEYDIKVATVDQPKKLPRYAWVKNLDKDAQVMLDGNVDPETDSNYLTIAAGDAIRIPIRSGQNKFYLKGPSTFGIILTDDGASPFKSQSKGGGETEWITSIAENHNNIFRGDDLFAKGYTIDDICAMIADGSFSDIYIGDYFTLSGSISDVPCFVEQTGDDGAKSLVESTQTVTYNTKFRIAGLDTYLNTGDTAFTAHHAVIMPDNIIGSNRMNSTNVTTGGYTGSFMFTSVLPVYDTHFDAKFNNHLLSHRELLSNSASGNQANGWAWTDVKVNLISESGACGNTMFGNKYDVGMNYVQFPLLRITSKYICNSEWYWLRSVAWGTGFAAMAKDGSVRSANSSSASVAIRPCFCIG